MNEFLNAAKTTKRVSHISLTFFQLRVFCLAESLGAVESLAECPSLMTHASVPKQQREKSGLTETLIRLSVGIEGASILIAALDEGLALAYR